MHEHIYPKGSASPPEPSIIQHMCSCFYIDPMETLSSLSSFGHEEIEWEIKRAG